MRADTPELEALRARTQALEVAAAAATLLAVRNGATDQVIADRLAAAQRRLTETLPEAENAGEVEAARFALRCRQEICREMASVALEYQVDSRELADALTAVIETSSRMHQATTISDLGLATVH